MILLFEFYLRLQKEGSQCVRMAADNGHTETLALLLANKADVLAADDVNIPI